MTVTTAFFFMYFSGKCPLRVNATFCPTASSGLGVTVKLSFERGARPLLHPQSVEMARVAESAREREVFISVMYKEGKGGMSPLFYCSINPLSPSLRQAFPPSRQ